VTETAVTCRNKIRKAEAVNGRQCCYGRLRVASMVPISSTIELQSKDLTEEQTANQTGSVSHSSCPRPRPMLELPTKLASQAREPQTLNPPRIGNRRRFFKVAGSKLHL
jgi:hypothetical protein